MIDENTIRIGDKTNISEKVKPYQLERFLSTEKKRLQSELQKLSHLRKSSASFVGIQFRGGPQG